MDSKMRQVLEKKSLATPAFYLFPDVPAHHYHQLARAFSSVAKKFEVCFSVKTNPHPAILKALHSEGCGMEVVSQRELSQIKSFSTSKVFNACAATEEEFKEALKQKALIVLDSPAQAELLASIAPPKTKVGVRVRFDAKKFGFSPKELKPFLSACKKMGFEVNLLHAHPGTNVPIKDYERFCSRIAGILEDFPPIQYLDLGGGIPGSHGLKQRGNTLEDYAAVVRTHLGKHLKTKTLILETGRFLVEDSMVLLTQVQHTKETEDKPLAFLDAGINLLSRVTMSSYVFTALTQTGETKAHFRLAGPLMFGNDEVGTMHAALGRGDIIAVENVGAYCTELAWRISHDLPPVHVEKASK